MEQPKVFPPHLERRALAIIVALAAALRWARLGSESLWVDEAWSWWMSDGSYPRFLELLGSDVHPPGYYLVLRLWTAFAGASETALRTPSACFGVASVVALFFVGRRLFGPRCALLAAGFLAMSPFHIFYSQEARSYSQLTFFAIVSTGALIIWLSSNLGGRATPVVFAAATMGALYTHYAAILLIAAHQIIYITWRLRSTIRSESPPKPTAFQWCMLQLAIVTCFLPGLQLMTTQASAVGDTLWIAAPTTAESLRVLGLLAGIRVPGAITPGAAVVFPAIALVLVVSTLAGLTPSGRHLLGVGDPGTPSSDQQASPWLIVPWVVVPPLAALGLAQIGIQVFTPRNLIITLPGTILLASCGVISIRSLGLRIATLALILGLPTAGLTALLHGGLKEEWNKAAELVRATSQPGDLFLYDAWFARPAMEYSLGYATPTVTSMYSIPAQAQRLWLIRSHPRDPLPNAASALCSLGLSPHMSAPFRGIELSLFVRDTEALSIRTSRSTTVTSNSRGATNLRNQGSPQE